jgi:thiol-disulfide isomerase/thioredoxin
MKRTRLAASLLFAATLCFAFEGQPAGAQQQQHLAVAPAAHAPLVPAQAKRRRKPSRRKLRRPLPVVQEIDGDGLKKLMQRDANAPRPLLINFWATWCNPCREEFPDLVQIGKDYKTRNLDFVIVSLDDPVEIKTTVPRFLQRMRAAMPAYLLNAAEPDSVINSIDPEWGGGMPATFLYDAAGQVVYKHLGPINPDELRKELDKTLNAATTNAQP